MRCTWRSLSLKQHFFSLHFPPSLGLGRLLSLPCRLAKQEQTREDFAIVALLRIIKLNLLPRARRFLTWAFSSAGSWGRRRPRRSWTTPCWCRGPTFAGRAGGRRASATWACMAELTAAVDNMTWAARTRSSQWRPSTDSTTGGCTPPWTANAMKGNNKGWPRHFSRCLKCFSLLQREKWRGYPLEI